MERRRDTRRGRWMHRRKSTRDIRFMRNHFQKKPPLLATREARRENRMEGKSSNICPNHFPIPSKLLGMLCSVWCIITSQTIRYKNIHLALLALDICMLLKQAVYIAWFVVVVFHVCLDCFLVSKFNKIERFSCIH